MTDNCGFSRRGHGGRERERKSGGDGVLEKEEKRGDRDGGWGWAGGRDMESGWTERGVGVEQC